MKTKITIYKADKLFAEAIVKSKKEDDSFIRNTLPIMKMSTRVKEGWKIFRSY